MGRYVSHTEGHVTTHRYVDDYDPRVHTYAAARNLRPGDVVHAHGHRWLEEPLTVRGVSHRPAPDRPVTYGLPVQVVGVDDRVLQLSAGVLCVIDLRADR